MSRYKNIKNVDMTENFAQQFVLSILLFSGSKNSEDSKICPETCKEIGQEVNWFKLGPSILCNS
jgi:hypothetical protein